MNKPLELSKTKLGKFILTYKNFIESFILYFHVVMAFIFVFLAYSALTDGRLEAGLLYLILNLNFVFTAVSEQHNSVFKKMQSDRIDELIKRGNDLIDGYNDLILNADTKNPNALLIMQNQIKELCIKQAESLKELDKKM